MKITYSSDEVRNKLDSKQESHPDLYKQFCIERSKVKRMDYDDFWFYLSEELGKSNNSKRIKRMDTDEEYEFRIPPKHPKGVLRVYFHIESDFNTICITGDRIETNEPQRELQKSKVRR